MPSDPVVKSNEHVQRHSESINGGTMGDKKIGQDIAYRAPGKLAPPNSATFRGPITKDSPNVTRAKMKPEEPVVE